MKKNILYSFLSILFKILSRLVLIFLLARYFTLNEFGIYTYSLTISGVLILFFDYGYNIKLLKEIPRNFNLTNQYIYKAIIIKIIFILFIFISLNILDLKQLLNLKSYDITVLFYFLLISIFTSFTNLFILPFKATNKFYIESFIYGVEAILILVSTISIIYFFDNIFMYTIYVITLSKMFVTVLAFILYIREYNIKYFSFNILKEIKTLLPYGIHFFIAGMYLSVDTIILKLFVTNEKLAIYQAALRLLIGVSLFFSIANSVLLPKLSSLSKNMKELINFTVKANYTMLLLGFLIVIFLYCFQKELIFILFGNKFTILIDIFPYFIVIIFIRSISTVNGILLTISNKQGIRAITVSFTLFYIIILDYYCIPIYGLEGAAIILLSAHILVYIVYMYFVFSEYKILFFKRIDNEKNIIQNN